MILIDYKGIDSINFYVGSDTDSLLIEYKDDGFY